MKDYQFNKRIVLRTPVNHFLQDDDGVTLNNKLFNEALFLSSPQLLDEKNRVFNSDNLSDGKNQKLNNSILKYATRMRSRATPFGLFAACSTGYWSEDTNIKLNNSNGFNRHTRLDMDYLCALAQELAKKDYIKNHIKFFPNSSIYTLYDKIRYVEYKYKNNKRIHQIATIDQSEYIEKILAKAKSGANINELATTLVDDEISFDEAYYFIEEIVEAQLLVSEMEPAITGPEFTVQIIDVLQRVQRSHPNSELIAIIEILLEAQKKIKEIDQNIINDVNIYYTISEKLKNIGVGFELNRLFQTDLIKTTESLVLSKKYQSKILKSLELLNSLTFKTPKNPNLEEFKNEFYNRYEEKEMPLLEVLDSETGISYLKSNKGKGDFNPLINDISLPTNSSELNIKWDNWTSYLHEKVIDLSKDSGKVLKLDKKEIFDQFSEKINKKSSDLPTTMAVMFSLLGTEENEEKLYVKSLGGSSAANLLGRFANADSEIENLISDITTIEKNHNPNVIYAEIVHLPQSRLGNILIRPVLRPYEIPYLAKSGVDNEHTIGLDDLYISIRNQKIILRSKRLGKEIIPRLSTAHNYSSNALPVYQFLCDLQSQGKRSGVGFNWSGLQNILSFLPRVEYENTILSLASWKLRKADFECLLNKNEEDLLHLISDFREKFKLPLKVVLADNDNELLVDFSDLKNVKMWLDTIKKRNVIKLKEFVFNPKDNVVNDIDGNSYINQFITVLNKKENTIPKKEEKFKHQNQKVKIRFTFGSEWLYFKLYCGNKTADRVLTQAIKPLTEKLIGKNLINKWFYIRYADPENHLRVRLQLKDNANRGEVISLIDEHLKTFQEHNLIWKTQMDEYYREIERYGSNSMETAESLFFYESVAIVNALDMIEGDAGENIRWKFGIKAIDGLLASFNYSFEDRKSLLEKLKLSFGKEFGMNRLLKKQLDSKFRKERTQIESILNLNQQEEDKHEMFPLFQILNWKSKNISTLVEEIEELEKENKLELQKESLLASYIHMLLNRLFKSKQRMHEMVIYDFMYRYYKSKLARTKQVNKCGIMENQKNMIMI